MDTSRRRFIRLAIVTATAAGVALASPAVVAADESEVIEAAPIGENSEPPVVIVPTTEPLVIELIVVGEPPTDSTEPPDGAGSEEPAGDDTTLMATESPSDQAKEPAETEAMPTDSELVDADPSPMVAAPETSSAEKHTGGTGDNDSGGTGDDHSGGTGGDHSGGGGTGNPYVMTFEVVWQTSDGSAIPVLELPTDWQSMFDLAAASATGGGKPTSAHCTYPDGSTELVCEFENPGKHSSVTDGMIVPGKPTATYTVTVPWPISGWTIVGANADSYSARDLCPRGGDGHDGGHDSGHDGGHDSGETHEVAALDDSGFICLHTVVIRQIPVTPEPPAVEPPAQDPPASEVPAVEPAPSETPTPPASEVLPVTVTPRALPATGNTATTTLLIGTIILAMGGCLLVLARRRNDLELT
jgi:LPXTG-motif cell wall-anchored protein